MEINLTKSERTIAVTALAVISVFVAMFIQISRKGKAEPQFEIGSAINYTMARPDQVYSEYTLDGRELDQTFEGLPKTSIEGRLDKRKKELIAKKVADIKKRDELKKKQAIAKTQEAVQNKLKEQAQSPKYSDKTREKNESKTETHQNKYTNQNANVAPVVQAAPGDNKTPAVKPKKTFTEWRNMLIAGPTTENLTLFITAYRRNEVTVTEFQAMAQDLLDQNDPKLKGLGLMALRSAPSLASLSQLVHLQPAAIGTYQAYVDQSIMSYLQTQNLPYLNQALATKDKTLVARALNLLSANLLKFSQGDFAGLIDPRNRREGEVINFSMNTYRTLLPALNLLGTSQDQEFSVLAQQITALIQTSNNVAQN